MALVINRRNAAEADLSLTLPNPSDQAALVQAINAGVNSALEDRLVIAVAARHPYADRLFQSATPAAVPFGPFTETLPKVSDTSIDTAGPTVDSGSRRQQRLSTQWCAYPRSRRALCRGELRRSPAILLRVCDCKSVPIRA
jgi:hypothetical protein